MRADSTDLNKYGEVLSRKKFVYFKIPRCNSTNFRKKFTVPESRLYVSNKKNPIKPNEALDLLPDYKLLAIVRNPYYRYISIVKRLKWWNKKDHHAAPAVNFLPWPLSKMDYIVKIEDTNFVDRIKEITQVNVRLRHNNSASFTHKKLFPSLGIMLEMQEDKALLTDIQSFYAEDFRAFNYDTSIQSLIHELPFR